MPWTKVFDPSLIILESLEQALSSFTGAVIIATPDDITKLRAESVRAPRENVMLEYGLMSARLGRPNVVLCQFGDAQLPSDLEGLDVIKILGKGNSGRVSAGVGKGAGQQLRTWASKLLATAEPIPRTQVVHGYTGQWKVEVALKVWRGIRIRSGSTAILKAEVHLLVPRVGSGGSGMARGRLTFELAAAPSKRKKPFSGEYRIAHEISNLRCNVKGHLDFESCLFNAQLMTKRGGVWPELVDLGRIPEEWQYKWSLWRAGGQQGTLEGTFETFTGGHTLGKVTQAVKVSA